MHVSWNEVHARSYNLMEKATEGALLYGSPIIVLSCIPSRHNCLISATVLQLLFRRGCSIDSIDSVPTSPISAGPVRADRAAGCQVSAAISR